MWTLEGMSLIALGALTVWAWLADVPRVDQFLGWIYVFVGGARMLSGAVHRGPGLAWMLASAVVALAAGLVLLLHGDGGLYAMATVLALFLLGEALTAFGLSTGAGAQLACGRWLAWVAVADILLASVAVMAAGDGRQGVLIVVVALGLWLEGVTLLVMGHRWEALSEPIATRPPRGPRSGSRTYRPWSRSWRD
jgi:hypothetical protein